MDYFGTISLLVGIIGTAVAIYQAAIIRETKKRGIELQFILAGINNTVLQKQQGWQNQINTLPKLESAQDWEMGRLYLRARDDFGELAALTAALESTIDIGNSAITSMMDKAINITKKSNELQKEVLKNQNRNMNPTKTPEQQGAEEEKKSEQTSSS